MNHLDQYRNIRDVVDLCHSKRPDKWKHFTKFEQSSYIIYVSDKSVELNLLMDLQADRVELENIICRGGQIEDIVFFENSNFPPDSVTKDNSCVAALWFPAEGDKCERCWKLDKFVNDDKLCPRCDEIVPRYHKARRVNL